MSLGLVFKGPEGIVLAADSRVTLTAEIQDGDNIRLLPATFDNATKLLQVSNQKFVGAVTYGAGAIGQQHPRTAHSFLPEFEASLKGNKQQMKVQRFAEKLSEFFLDQWKALMPSDYTAADMVFLVGGYDKGEPYGRVFKIEIPSSPAPVEQSPGDLFGLTWGGQMEYTSRLIKGFDPRLTNEVQQHLKLTDEQRQSLESHLDSTLSLRIPYQFLPLQDCVDLSIFLIRTTADIQQWLVSIRGVGGAIDVATITRTEGFKPIQMKQIGGEHG